VNTRRPTKWECKREPGTNPEKTRREGKALQAQGHALNALHGESEKENLPAIAAVPAITTTIAATASATAPTITTPAAATTATVTAPPTTATGAFGLRTRFVNDQVPAPEILTIEARHGAVGVFIIGNLDESETT
jgi:hypothetical protein